ncbi:MAG TPA: hypothetical protein VHS54_11305 [Jatrophihabitans sp.]|jgi:predicted small secreted protein|nr:hypothetical protein [Jatrophihabitans sp.]
MRTRTALAALVAAAAALAGCTDVVTGAGTSRVSSAASPAGPSVEFPSGSSAPVAPSQSGPVPATSPDAPSPPAAIATPCPHVVYPAAHLSYDCLTDGLVARPHQVTDVWPLTARKTVEAKTGWVVEEGAGHWGSPDGHSLAAIASAVRRQMVDDGGYGTNPGIDSVANRDLTLAGVKGHLLQTTFTINPTFAAKVGTKVRREKLWIIALAVGTGDVSLWYTSVPDLVSELWPKVPSIIASIRVS